MSVIISGHDKKHIYMGGDSAVSCGGYTTQCDPKVIRVGDALLGMTGTSRLFTVATAAAEQLRGTPHINTFVETLSDGWDPKSEFEALYAVDGEVYTIDGELGIDRVYTDWCAIGSGAEVARGAMGALGSVVPDTPMVKRIRMALRLVGDYRNDITGPYYVLDIPAQSD